MSFEEFCVSGLWVDYVSDPCVDKVDEAVGSVEVDKAVDKDDWDFDVDPW